jgi:hypothetical protein
VQAGRRQSPSGGSCARDSGMRKILVTAACTLAFVSTSARAQMAEKVDPATGNYVPVRDPLLRDDPNPDAPNPNRLGNRQSKRNSATTAPPSSTPSASSNDGLTPAQHMAANAANNGQAAPVITSADGQSEQTTADGFVSMGGMATYTPPGSQSQTPDVFAKPDWWPQ